MAVARARSRDPTFLEDRHAVCMGTSAHGRWNLWSTVVTPLLSPKAFCETLWHSCFLNKPAGPWTVASFPWTQRGWKMQPLPLAGCCGLADCTQAPSRFGLSAFVQSPLTTNSLYISNGVVAKHKLKLLSVRSPQLSNSGGGREHLLPGQPVPASAYGQRTPLAPLWLPGPHVTAHAPCGSEEGPPMCAALLCLLCSLGKPQPLRAWTKPPCRRVPPSNGSGAACPLRVQAGWQEPCARGGCDLWRLWEGGRFDDSHTEIGPGHRGPVVTGSDLLLILHQAWSEPEHSTLVDTEKLLMAFIRTRKKGGWLQFLTL